MKNCDEKYQNLLDNLMQQIVLSYPESTDYSLYYGKMGAIICLFEYGRYTKHKVYIDLAGDWLEELCIKLPLNLSNNFAYGYCGIAWGVTYLILQEFVEGDIDDVLEDLDVQIMNTDIMRLTDTTIDTGLAGFAYYALTRLQLNRLGLKEKAPFDLKYIDAWKQLLPSLISQKVKDEINVFSQLEDYFYSSPNLDGWKIKIPSFIYDNTCDENLTDIDFIRTSIGLHKGLSGSVIKIMQK